MRIGSMIGVEKGQNDLEALIGQARELEASGFATAWLPHVFGHDAVTAAAVIGRETQRIEIGTAVVPTPPRHPTALAQQAITGGTACAGRFTLGIGLSHPVVIEGVLGLSYARRAAHMREYMEVLAPLLAGEPAQFQGDEFRVALTLAVPDARPVPVLIAALGDRMLEIAGRRAAGTILWMTGPRTIESHTAPKLRAAAREAGRPAPRIVAGLQIVLTADREAVLERMAKRVAVYRQMPSYLAMLEKEGVDHPVKLALVGGERALEAGLARLRDVGVTDFEAVVVSVEEGARERTFDFLASQVPRLASE
jgi:F420-dependent oxidoreductase-like protein